MSSSSLAPTGPDAQRPPRPLRSTPDYEDGGQRPVYITKHWDLRSDVRTQASAWVPKLEHAAAFPNRNSYSSGEFVLQDDASRGHSDADQGGRTRILQTTTTTQTVGRTYSYTKAPLKRHSLSPATLLTVTHTPSPTGAETSFTLDLDRSLGPAAWDMLASSSTLDIVEDYDEESDDERHVPRPLPSTLPPIPALPPPSTGSSIPRGPQNLEELAARGQRNVSNESLDSNDPLDPANYRRPHESRRIVTPPVLRLSDRRPSGPSERTKIRVPSHQKSQSQAHLLPLHLNQFPHLSVDKPVESTARWSGSGISLDLVRAHWYLLVCFIAFPPFWLLLAGGAFDAVLHVPSVRYDDRGSLLSASEMAELRRIRIVKRIAGVSALAFGMLCVAGFSLGLALA